MAIEVVAEVVERLARPRCWVVFEMHLVEGYLVHTESWSNGGGSGMSPIGAPTQIEWVLGMVIRQTEGLLLFLCLPYPTWTYAAGSLWEEDLLWLACPIQSIEPPSACPLPWLVSP